MAINERRYKTQKIINKRLKISKECFRGGGIEQQELHRVHKWNFTCDCSSCKAGKERKTLKEKKLEQIKE